MGWLFTRLDQNALIKELTRFQTNNNGTTHTSIDNHFDPGECVLWSVTEMTSTRKHLRYIECFLMQASPEGWEYPCFVIYFDVARTGSSEGINVHAIKRMFGLGLFLKSRIEERKIAF